MPQTIEKALVFTMSPETSLLQIISNMNDMIKKINDHLGWLPNALILNPFDAADQLFKF